MGFDLHIFKDQQFDVDYLGWLVDERSIEVQQRFTKLWEYYTRLAAEDFQKEASESSGDVICRGRNLVCLRG